MKRARFITTVVVSALLLALVAATPVLAGKGSPPGTWYTLAPVPAAGGIEGAAVGGVDDILIVAYGMETSLGDTNACRLYNISTDTWTMGASAPTPSNAELAYGELTHGGKLYAIGGRGGMANIESYEVATDTWATLAPMPTGRCAAAAAIVGNAIYVIGGRTTGGGPGSGAELAVVERYDIDSDSWTTVASLASARSDMAVVSHGGKIYVFGGYSGGVIVGTVDVYDPVTDTWTGLSPMTIPRAAHMAGKVGNYAYLIGGMTPALTDVNEVYNIVKDTWSTDTSMPGPLPGQAVGETGAYSHGGGIYIPGGGQPAYGTGANFNQLFMP
jgi:hypothetical protein